MLDALLATVGWLIACGLPGYLVAGTLRSPAGRLRNAALAPVIGLGLTMVVAQVLQMAGIEVRPGTILAVTLGLPAVSWLVNRARRGADGFRAATASGATRGSVTLLVAASAVGLYLWLATIPSFDAVLPNDDGTHHALYASRILTLRTIDPSTVLAGDLATRSPTDRYYPLALHVTTAMISGATGVPVNAVLTVGYVLAAAVVLPLGVYVLARRVLPERPVVAGLAALMSTTLPWFPFSPVVWGGVALIVGMALVPAVLDATCRPDQDCSGVMSGGVLLGLTWYGLFSTHNSEVVTVELFGVVFALVGRTYRERRLLAHWAGAGVVTMMMLAPQIPALIAGANERSAAQGNGPTGTLSASVIVLGASNLLVLPIALYGLVIAVRRRTCIACVWAVPAVALLCLAASGVLGPLRLLTTPYYSSAVRISYNFGYLETIFAALGLAAIGTSLLRHVSERRTSTVALRWVAALAVALMAGLDLSGDVAFVSTAYRADSLVGPDQRAAFAWLAAHTAPRARVLNQFDDGSGWLSTLDAVAPVFATKANAPYPDPSVAWGDRWYLLTHAGALATDQRAQAVIRRWDVQFVYVNARRFGLQQELLSAAALSKSPAYHLVWQRGTVTVFEVDPALRSAAEAALRTP